MYLSIIGTGSQGNAYVLGNQDEALLIECGVNIKSIKKALDFNLEKVAGCIVTHEHLDHAKSINEVMSSGIDVWASAGTHVARKTDESHRARTLINKVPVKIGNFKILPFDVKHDAAEPMGFLINHKDCGNVLFLTDTYYSPYKFANLHNIIIEANFSQKIIDEKVASGASEEFLRNRILKSHLSLENCVDLLDANDLTKVNNIVLIHLSDTNSHEADFKKCIEINTGKNVTVASNNMKINFKKTPF